MSYEGYLTKLKEVYDIAKALTAEPAELNATQKTKCKVIIASAQRQKAVLTVLITSFLKKIKSPTQDVRQHQDNLAGGYSGRSMDTSIVTPFMKKYYKRFAMSESGWLTRSLEQNRPYDREYPGRISNVTVKEYFLDILEDLEVNNIDPQFYLKYFFFLLNIEVEYDNKLYEELKDVDITGAVSIPLIIDMLKEHFEQPVSSRLPVLAIYSIYEILIKNIDRYKDTKLEDIKSHTTADRYSGFADIEIYDKDGKEFEGIEIKHGIQISIEMIMTVLEKIQHLNIDKYYILTTANPNFDVDVEIINELILRIKTEYHIDLIPNGIFLTIKYYLRFVENYTEFLENYNKNLLLDFKNNTDVLDHHIASWNEILKKNNLLNEEE